MTKIKAGTGFYSLAMAVFLVFTAPVFAADGPAQPPLSDALRIDGMEEILKTVPPDLRTGGINHVLGQDALEEDVSTLNLDFDFTFEFGDQESSAQTRTCGSGCRLLTAGKAARVIKENGALAVESPVVIFRFAKQGRLTLADGTGVDWLVRMVDGETLRGVMRLPLNENGEPTFPGELELDGKMIITMKVDGEEPVNLLSELDSSLTGDIYEWPPRHTQFALKKHVPYFDARLMAPAEGHGQIGRTMALVDQMTAPTITILENNTRIGEEPSPFLSMTPEITRTWVVSHAALDRGKRAIKHEKVAGLGLQWTDTSAFITGPLTCPCTRYHVYRNDDPGNLNGWFLVGTVPATETTYIDESWDGLHDAEYMVLNGSEFKFGYIYEGSPGYATLVHKVN